MTTDNHMPLADGIEHYGHDPRSGRGVDGSQMTVLILPIACFLTGLSAGLFIGVLADWWDRRNQ